MRGISREVLARDAAWTLADGHCKDLTAIWADWEATHAAAPTAAARKAALTAPAAVCHACPVQAECADLAELSLYSGIAAGRGYRNGHPDNGRVRAPKTSRRTA